MSPTLSITQVSSSSNGYLNSTDWNTFNGKASASGTLGQVAVFNGANSLSSSSALTFNGTQLQVPAGTATVPSLAVGLDFLGNPTIGLSSGTGGTANGALQFTIGGYSVGQVFGVQSGPVFGWVLGSDSNPSNLYVGGQLLVMNSSAFEVGRGALGSVSNGVTDGVLAISGDGTGQGISQGAFIELYGHTHLTKPDVTEFYSNAVLNASISNLGVWSFVNAINPIQGITGVTTNSNAASGIIGEYISNSVYTPTSFPASGTYGDITSITLTAGDWDLTGFVFVGYNGTTFTGVSQMGISTSSGTGSADLVNGKNVYNFTEASAIGGVENGSVPGYRVSIASTTTYYLKIYGTYTGNSPQYQGRLSARRVR
jgi:hypothetical protein